MAIETLEQVKYLVNLLTPMEQAELLEYLSPRLVQAVKAGQTAHPKSERKATLEEFRRISDKIATEIAANDDANSETLTQEFLRTRR